jgi:hypothetical protein
LAALLTVTVDLLHLSENSKFREKLEAAYFEALALTSAFEEQYHAKLVGDDPEARENAHFVEL